MTICSTGFKFFTMPFLFSDFFSHTVFFTYSKTKSIHQDSYKFVCVYVYIHMCKKVGKKYELLLTKDKRNRKKKHFILTQ